MKLCFIDTLGLCYDGSTLSKRGLGGSESAIILMSRELAKIGFDVTVFNDCQADDAKPGIYDNVLYRPLREVETCEETFDVVIGSRSVSSFAPDDWREQFKTFTEGMPKFEAFMARSGHKILWMHDTFCDGDEYIENFVVQGRIDEVFTLSDWHTTYITNADHGYKRMFEVLKKKIFQTRNGIGAVSNDWIDVRVKDPNHFVYNSSVTKGMYPLLQEVWPRIKKRLPNAHLTVIGGYYRLRSNLAPDENEQKWRQLADDPSNLMNDVYFTGIIKQSEISDFLRVASFMIYPAEFPETFGISTLESLAHNTPLITCDFGALEETAVDDCSYKIPYPIVPNSLFPHINAEWQFNAFADMAVEAYNDKYLHQQKMYACNKIKDICTWDTVALQWKQHLFKKLGRFLTVSEYRAVTKINHDVRKAFGRRFYNEEELQEPRNSEQLAINIVTPVYNSENYIRNCILSVAQQDYENYKMYIIDDCSTDGTKGVAADTIAMLPKDLRAKFEILSNYSNFGAVYNQYTTIKQHCKGDIIMLLDGDDCLVNDSNIFHKYNNIYHDGAEFTYGSCWSVADNIPLIAQEYPPEVKQNKTYREYKFNWNMPYTHLRTFQPFLLNTFSAADFQDENGNWLRAGGDTAMFYNLIEKANSGKVVCIPEVVYMYNDANPLNDYKVNSDEQTKNANLILKKSEESMMKKKILIALPTAKNIETETFKSIYDLEVPEGYETELQFFYGYQIDQVRNLIADWAKGYDYLFCVDSDIVLPKDCLTKMFSEKFDMVSGVYIQRKEEDEIVEIYRKNDIGGVRNVNLFEIMPPGLHEIDGCGFGCVLIDCNVIRAMKYPHFVYRSALDHADTFSEDVYFCQKAKEAGARIWVDSTIVCNHLGSKVFTPSDIWSESNIQKYLRYISTFKFREEDVRYFNTMKKKNIQPKVIYDIGCATGMWTREVRNVWPEAEIVMFDAMEELEFLMKETGNKYHIDVLSDKSNKEVDFYKNVWAGAGNSYYKEIGHRDSESLFTEDHKQKRITKSLDDIVAWRNFPAPDLIKIDVQGAELDVLKGASKALETCEHLLIEMQHKNYNQGAPLKPEVSKYIIESLGFDLEHSLSPSESDGDYHFVKKQKKESLRFSPL